MQRPSFKKIVLLGYVDSDFGAQLGSCLADLAEQVVAVAEGSKSVQNALADADCLLAEPGIPIDSALLDCAPRLRYLGIFGTDCSRVDVEYAAKRGIPVCNTPGYSTGAVAEFVFGVILDHIRGLTPARLRVSNGSCTALGAPGTELAKKTFGVLGLGRIGSRVAEIARRGFGADVRYWSRTRRPHMEQAGIGYTDMATLLRHSDFISIHVAHRPDTKHLINAGRIEQIKPGAVLVHLSPLELIDLDALERRLERGDMTIILDHTDELPAEQLERLARHDNCVMYPAIACTTREAKCAKQTILSENLESFFAGQPANRVTT